MQTIITNTLTSRQYHEAMNLINICREYDNTHGISFLESELNAIPEFPCFYLLYDKNELVSLLSIFIISENECEIYANTLPEHRKNGYFHTLLTKATKNLKSKHINNILIVHEPGCKADSSYLSSSDNISFCYSEYLMCYDMSINPTPNDTLTISYNTNENTEHFVAFLNDTPISECNVEHNRGVATIYGFLVYEDMRGKGYGTETLLLVLKRLIDSGCHKILLQVNGANTAAHTMYSNHGFYNKEQIDYWSFN